MRRLPISMLLLASACSIDAGPPLPTGTGAVKVGADGTITLDESKVPTVPSCTGGQYIRRTADGSSWECVTVSAPSAPTWDDVGGKPTEFPPEAHQHVVADITGFNAGAVAAMGVKGDGNPLNHDRYTDPEAVAAVTTAGIPWDSVNGKPTTFPPATHTHTTVAHNHAVADVTSFDTRVSDDVLAFPSSTVWPGTVPAARVTGLAKAVDDEVLLLPASTEWPGTVPATRVSGFDAAVTGLPSNSVWPGTLPAARITGATGADTAAVWPGHTDWNRLDNVNAVWAGTIAAANVTGFDAAVTGLPSTTVWPGTVPVGRVTYARTVWLTPVSSVATNGTNLVNALAAITDAAAAKTYLVKLEPGLYDLGSGSLSMKAFVDIEGSGEGTTKITGSGFAGTSSGTVVGASNAEIRYLTVENLGSAANAAAFYASGASPKLSNVTLTASGGTTSNRALVLASNAAPAVQLATLSATATGTATATTVDLASNSSPTFQTCSITVTSATGVAYGIAATAASATVRGSVIKITAGGTGSRGVITATSGGVDIAGSEISTGSFATVEEGSSTAIQIFSSILAGAAKQGTPACRGVTDESYGTIATDGTCP